MRTPLGLVQMCTTHMVNAMNKVMRDSIPYITMPYLEDIPIKGCPED